MNVIVLSSDNYTARKNKIHSGNKLVFRRGIHLMVSWPFLGKRVCDPSSIPPPTKTPTTPKNTAKPTPTTPKNTAKPTPALKKMAPHHPPPMTSIGRQRPAAHSKGLLPSRKRVKPVAILGRCPPALGRHDLIFLVGSKPPLGADAL